MTIQQRNCPQYTLALHLTMRKMKKYLAYSLLSISCLLTLSACCEKKIYCTDGYLDFTFTGFTISEVRGFTIRQYIKDDANGEPIDSAQYIYSGAQQIASRDTFTFSDYRTVGDLQGIAINYDWEVYVPAVNRTYRFTAILNEGVNDRLVRCNDNETSCVNQINQFLVNDNWRGGNHVYIEK